MLASYPHDYPRLNNKKRSLGCDAESQWAKRSKQYHSSTNMSWTSPISSTPFQSTVQEPQPQPQEHQQRSLPTTAIPLNAVANDTVKNESVDVMMVDGMGSSCFSERIDDMEKYLNDEDDSDIKAKTQGTTGGQPIDIYALLERQHRPLTAMLVNGVLLPMEQQQGGTKHCIPEFVLRSPKSTTSNKSNSITPLNYIPLKQSSQTPHFMLGNNDSMDID